MNPELEQQILQANIEAHNREAVVYERAHPEIFGSREQARIRDLVERVATLVGGRRAFDVGCGTGAVTLKLIAAGFTVDALDISPAMLHELEKKLGAQNQSVKFIAGDVDSFLASSSDQYDLITVSSVLHHLPDYDATLRAMVARLAPGGVILILHEPVGIDGHWFLRRFLWLDAVLYNLFFLPRSAQRVVFGIDYGMVDYQVGRGFSMDATLGALRSAGCAVLHEERYSALKFTLTSWILERITRTQLHFALIALKN